jgi:malate dehydrogenase (oxaloacetate-decarboxylating)
LAEKYATVIATGHSDNPNQINIVLALPGIFRGALTPGALRITTSMEVAAAKAIAALVGDNLSADYIVLRPLDERVAAAVSAASVQSELL